MSVCECGCGKPANARFILGHNLPNLGKTLAERFWEKVDKQGPMPSPEAVAAHPEIEGTPCWEWTSSIDRYGHMWVEGRAQAAHRVAWFVETGEWPEFFACHKCDNGTCVRFSHLFDGTQKQNMEDGKAKNRFTNHGSKPLEFCKRGHKLKDSYVYEGRHSCRECRNERERRRRNGQSTTSW